ncbi:hypothetical protein MANES_18G137828v8 [Manihot esculenta]|uniref:Uncharacterized protein n=1 Tax=Manihot esculenta TaxID=3983 RepID=A0ACB7G0K5_MANES|nr:hypothetical protein MANES_18G137828v8 [Manihot esculenta]
MDNYVGLSLSFFSTSLFNNLTQSLSFQANFHKQPQGISIKNNPLLFLHLEFFFNI